MNAIRVPSFAQAATTSALVLVVFSVLMVIDRLFLGAILLTSVDLGLSSYPDIDQAARDEVDVVIGVRRWLVVALGLLAIVSSAVMLGRLFIGISGRSSKAAMLTASAVVAGWLGFLTLFERVLDFSIYTQIKRQIPELQVLAQRLRADWPVESVEIPPVGFCGKDADLPNSLTVAEAGVLAPFGWIEAIHKHGEAILFDFSYSSGTPCSIEFHQGATTPRSFVERVSHASYRHELDSFEMIDEGVYLSQYHESIELENGEVIEVLWE